MEPREIQEYIKSRSVMPDSSVHAQSAGQSFVHLCEQVKQAFFAEWEKEENTKSLLDIQKKAIIGYEREVSYFKDRIES